jgi:hypothetical protein
MLAVRQSRRVSGANVSTQIVLWVTIPHTKPRGPSFPLLHPRSTTHRTSRRRGTSLATLLHHGHGWKTTKTHLPWQRSCQVVERKGRRRESKANLKICTWRISASAWMERGHIRHNTLRSTSQLLSRCTTWLMELRWHMSQLLELIKPSVTGT